MKYPMEKLWVFIFLITSIFSGRLVDALSYDYSASIECLALPLKPQYGGGVIRNPEFNIGLRGWSSFGRANTELRKSATGNNFLVARGRDKPYQSLSQKTHLHKDKLYTFSSWVQVSEGSATVTVIFKTDRDQFTHAGTVEAKSGCWSLLKGGLTVNSTDLAEFYFESKNTTIEIWVDNISLQPFTKDQWRAHQAQSIDQAQYLEEILREGFSHPAVQGIVIWAPWHPQGSHRMYLTDNNFKNLPTGDVVDKLLAEWKSGRAIGMADSDGFFEAELFHGDYQMTVDHPSRNSSLVQSLKVDVESGNEGVHVVQFHA